MRLLESMRSTWILGAVAVLALAAPASFGDEGWLFTTVDSGPNSQGYTSLAVLPSGHPAISYVETISGGGDPQWDLKYAWFDGNAWNITAVGDGEHWSTHASLAILPSGYPAVSYYDYVNDDLKYGWFDGSEWQFATVDSDGNVGEYNSIAVLQTGHPAISYRDADAPALKYAWFDGSEWHAEVVADGPADYTSLAILGSAQPAISYRGNDYPQNLKYAWFDGSVWRVETADPEGQTGLHTSLATLPSGQAAISYCRYASGNNALKYAWFDGSVWRVETVVAESGAGLWNSLAIQPSGQPAISYAGLKYAWRDDGENWHVETVDSMGGTQTSMVVLPSGLPAISYGNGGDLMYAARCTFPVITQQPEGAERCEGEAVTFTVVVEGDPPLDYQWRKDGEDISGANADTYSIGSVELNDAGVYDVVVTNDCGSTTSDPATLAVADTEPDISEQPQSQIACVGDTVTLSVAAGPEPLSFQWYKKGAGPIDGATEASYTIDPVGLGDAGGYHVVVTNPCGSATSNPALLTVAEGDPNILEHPQDQAVCVGEPVTFSVTTDATNQSHETYQWRKDGEDIPDATDDSFTIDQVTVDDAGAYDVVVSNPCASVISDPAMLTVGPPIVLEHPQSGIACVDDSVTFSVAVSGAEPLSYQWYKKGSGSISGATEASYTIDPVGAADAGGYHVVVTNACGAATSNSALLTVVGDALGIVEHPESQIACVGGAVTFCVTTDATNQSYESYQWRKDGEDIAGAISDCYTVDPVSVDDDGVYDVVVSNPCGSVISDPATLTVADEGPGIQDDPEDQVACVSGSVAFSVTASGPGLLEYQWRKDGAELEDDGRISGATTATLTIDPILAEDQGDYDVVVSNVCDSVTSDAAMLTVIDEGPGIAGDPEDQDKCLGDPVTFSVAASGPGPLEYQWRKDGVELQDDGRISGATTANLTIDPLMVEDQGDYDVVVSNPCDFVTSAAAVLTVVEEGPSIQDEPEDQDRCVGESVMFSVTAGGPEPLEYQWRKDGADLVDDDRISGATTATLTIDPVELGDEADYDVLVTNPCGSATSAAATLIVGGPRIDQNPDEVMLCEDDVATFSVVASGVRPLEYQWRKDGNDLADDDRITGANTATLTIDPALPQDTGSYDVVVTNRCASVTSEAAALNVDAKPRVTVQPESVTIVEGQSHLFCIAASGAEPLSYQWQKDGVDIEDANVDCYLTSEVGTYRCLVTNHCGSTASNNATLATVPVLSATASTPTPAIKEGDSARLTATPSGGLAPYSYRWSTQQTGQSITVTPAESAVYTVTVTDSLQQTAVAEVSVTVVAPMIVTARASAYTLAPGESSILTAVIASGGWAPFRYNWSTGETEASITVSPTQETTYSVTVTDSLDQTATATVTIAIHDATAPPPEPPSDEDDTDQSQEDVPPDDGEPPPSDTDDTDEPNEPDQTGQDVPPTPSGLCPTVGLITIGLTLLGLWRSGPVSKRTRRKRE